MQKKKETIDKIESEDNKEEIRIVQLLRRKVSRIMKNYMKTMMETYFVKNLVVFNRVSDEDVPAEMLKRNSYTLLNVSPRFF